MLDEAFPEDAMLAEGKHWPEDYIKAALNMLKKDGKHTEKSDVDVQKIADRFRKVLHGNAPLGYFNTVVRWYADDPDGFVKPLSTNGQVPNDKLKAVLQHLLNFLNNQALVDKYSTQVKDGMSLSDFSTMMKKVSDEDAKNAAKVKFKVEDKGYKIIPIMSYEELHEKFGGDDKTGYYKIKGSGWCHTNGESTYDYWTKNYTKFFFVIAKDNWQQIKPHDNPQKDDNAYDEYGLSLMAILVSDKGRLLNCTLRWNHVVEPKYTKSGRAVDKAFISFAELSQVTGLDVKVEVKQELAKLVEKFKNAPKGAKVYEGPEGICFASDHLYWYDRDLNPIDPPDEINKDFYISDGNDLTSLEGSPRIVNGEFRFSGTKITSLEGCSQKVRDFWCQGCKSLKSLEGAPKIVDGDFTVEFMKITSLEGMPREVGKNFSCSNTRIASLEGCPEKIGGSFDCSFTEITSLRGCPEKINGDFNCLDTSITSLEGCPKTVNGNFNCSGTSITSLEGCPEEVGGYLDCSNTSITSLEGCPQRIKRSFSCSYTDISSLEGCPQIINGAFFCNGTKITSFEGGPREVGSLNCSDCKLLKSLKGAPAEVKNISYSLFPRKMKSEIEKYGEWLKTNPKENYPG